MIVKLLTEHHLEFLSLKGGCRGSSESTLVKMSNCWKSHAAAQLYKSRYLRGMLTAVSVLLKISRPAVFSTSDMHCLNTVMILIMQRFY